MAPIGETIGGLFELLRLAARSRFRMRSAYWRWRAETVFGTDPAHRPPRRERWKQILAYGRWVHRMRKSRG